MEKEAFVPNSEIFRLRDQWRESLNVVAELCDVPAAVIMVVLPDKRLQLFAAGGVGNPFDTVEQERPDGHFCDTVIATAAPLSVSDARRHEQWRSGGGTQPEMIAYLGLPVRGANGSLFGTISIQDHRERRFPVALEKLLGQMRDRLEEQLSMMAHTQRLEELLSRRTQQLVKKSEEQQQARNSLEEVNTALRVLLDKSCGSQREIEERAAAMIRDRVFPHLAELEQQVGDHKGRDAVSRIKQNIDDVVSSFTHDVSSDTISFTPRELEVAELVKQGRTNKEIAAHLQLSSGTIELYRNNIRGKLGLKNKKINLRTYLLRTFR